MEIQKQKGKQHVVFSGGLGLKIHHHMNENRQSSDLTHPECVWKTVAVAMGMITRVRGRLRSLHTLPKLDEKVRDEKIAETVCLLSVLFLLPYCSRGHAPLLVSLGSWFLTTYSFLVLPILISANYKYPVRWLRHIIRKLPGK
ncbi:hypothetical protein D910_08666 [Dendroctonus ponderosae]|uniref:Uncharacterized protein n=1 Tax=Dendroctonus ponderosae TaxID=77166 RepID=U4UBQ1_DENPD|nr:hypothetical protein D910_08666 [Dendroctonus ponderosae]